MARMNVVLDTTVLVDVLHGFHPALQYLTELEGVLYCSEATRIEIIRGLRSHERRPAEQLFGGLRWVPVDETIARLAGELGRQWRRSHPGISSEDLAIAATAESLNAQLATSNVKHFPMFAGLRPPY